jgi:hypothetical protein
MDARPDERFRLIACFGKKAYATAMEAHRALRRMTARKAAWKRANRGRRLTVYRCPACDRHHIGGTPV